MAPDKTQSAKCPHCWKLTQLCLCKEIPKLKSHLHFLILQHPSEAKNPYGTGRLTSLALANSIHRIGLSWRSLSSILGEKKGKNWAVLYLGGAKETAKKFSYPPYEIHSSQPQKKINGVILLDGNWKQAKTIWWRNPWLSRLPRIILYPKASSLFNTIRRQPRRFCLSTIESAAYTLEHLEQSPQSAESLGKLLEKHIQKLKTI